MDEIPVAKRELNPEQKHSRFPNSVILIFFSGLILLVTGWLLWGNNNQQSTSKKPLPVVTNNQTTENGDSTSTEIENTDDKINNVTIKSDEPTQENIPENILGHLLYKEAPTEDLKAVTNDGSIRLRNKAATKFLQMQQDARRQGVILMPLSGFRTISQQEYLFFEIKEQRKQDASKRAKVSAPPGYSEHHTGYAIDIGDANAPATNLSPRFEQTAAYRWLSKNASRYSFELSFPPDNLQGISYEPWHWRYVGDTHSLETFYKVHQLKTKL